MSWFSRVRRGSHGKLETPEDEKYPEGKSGVVKGVTADFALNEGEKLGIHLTENNFISKIDAGSIAERDAKFKVGDQIVAVNGESADGMEVTEMIRDMNTVSLTATRKRNSVKGPVRRRCCPAMACTPPRLQSTHVVSQPQQKPHVLSPRTRRCANQSRMASRSRGPKTTPTKVATTRGDTRHRKP